MKEWHFFDKVYRVWLVLILCPHQDLATHLKNLTYVEDVGYLDGNSGAMIRLDKDTTTNGNNCYIVWMVEWNEGCLVHELSHLVMRVFDDKGVPVRNENTEAFAYYQEYWFREIHRVRKTHKDGRTVAQAKVGA